jgi:hypothetical protein
MKKGLKFLVFMLFLFLLLFISSTNSIHSQRNPDNYPSNCFDLIEVIGKDGIPSIDDPKFLSATEFENSNYFRDSMKVLGVVVDDKARAYPIDILNHHEIVNDVINGQHVSITYCPLTGSGLPFLTSVINNTSLGTTGFLFENNLVFYDRDSDSFWNQMYNSIWCSDVSHNIQNFPTIPVVDTTWETWSKMYPDSEVLSRDTGFLRNYDASPYGDTYDSNSIVLFPSQYDPTKMPFNLYSEKELTLVIADFNSSNYNPKLFPYRELEKSPVINLDINGESVVVIYDHKNLLVKTFSSDLSDGNAINFLENENLEGFSGNNFGLSVFKDKNGSIWNMKGEAIEGPLKGEKLGEVFSYTAYWFGASSFFPHGEIFTSPNKSPTLETTLNDSSHSVSNPESSVNVNYGYSFIFGLILVTVVYSKYFRKD